MGYQFKCARFEYSNGAEPQALRGCTVGLAVRSEAPPPQIKVEHNENQSQVLNEAQAQCPAHRDKVNPPSQQH